MKIYVDDNLDATNRKIEDIASQSPKRFDSERRFYDKLDIFGTFMKTPNPGERTMTQERHARLLS